MLMRGHLPQQALSLFELVIRVAIVVFMEQLASGVITERPNEGRSRSDDEAAACSSSPHLGPARRAGPGRRAAPATALALKPAAAPAPQAAPAAPPASVPAAAPHAMALKVAREAPQQVIAALPPRRQLGLRIVVPLRRHRPGPGGLFLPRRLPASSSQPLPPADAVRGCETVNGIPAAPVAPAHTSGRRF